MWIISNYWKHCIRTYTHALIACVGLAKKNSRVALKSSTRVFCRVPVQGLCHPRGTYNASRVRLNSVRVALSNSMLRRCQIEVKYAEGDADSVKSDAGGIISATRVAQTLHGDTAKNPRRTFKCHAGVFLQVPRGLLTRVVWRP